MSDAWEWINRVEARFAGMGRLPPRPRRVGPAVNRRRSGVGWMRVSPNC